MYAKILTATVFSLGLGSIAAAQVPFHPPGDWNATVAGAMFSDVTTGAVRTPEEITSNFNALSAEDQASVREYCKKFDTSSPGGTVTANDSTSSESKTSTDEAVREVCLTAGKL